MTGQPPRVTARGGFLIPAAVCEFSLDKCNRRRYYVSVSQQNIGYGTRKRRNSMGAWFFVAFMIAHKMIIAYILCVVKYQNDRFVSFVRLHKKTILFLREA